MQKWESRFTLLGLDPAKDTHYIQKCFGWELLGIEFPTSESVGTSVYLTQEWSWGLQRSPPLVCYGVRRQRSGFALGLDAARGTHCIQGCFGWKLLSVGFRRGVSMGTCVYLPRDWSFGFQRLPSLEYCSVQKGETGFTLGLGAPKVTHYIQKGFGWGLLSIGFHTKKSVDAHVYLSLRAELWGFVRSSVQQICLKLLSYNAYFWQRRGLGWFCFSVSVQYNIWNRGRKLIDFNLLLSIRTSLIYCR